MFDVSVSELAVIGAVALVVLGPEKLPKMARTVGTLVGRAQRYVNDVKADISREMELQELKKMRDEMQNAAQSMQSQFNSNLSEIESQAQQVQDELAHNADATPPVSADHSIAPPNSEPSSLIDAIDPAHSSEYNPSGSQQRSPIHEMLR